MLKEAKTFQRFSYRNSCAEQSPLEPSPGQAQLFTVRSGRYPVSMLGAFNLLAPDLFQFSIDRQSSVLYLLGQFLPFQLIFLDE
jgi:hypothetical protein